MARYGDPVRIYVFYRFQEGQFNQQVITSWRIQDYRSLKDSDTNYRIISSGLLLKNGTLPAIQAFDQGEFVSIQLQYQLPPAEEDFFKLYSWPLNFNESNLSLGRIYHRKMAKAIYPIFRAHLQSIGYTMEEHEICQKEQMPSTIS